MKIEYTIEKLENEAIAYAVQHEWKARRCKGFSEAQPYIKQVLEKAWSDGTVRFSNTHRKSIRWNLIKFYDSALRNVFLCVPLYGYSRRTTINSEAYDLVVCQILLILNHFSKTFRFVSSAINPRDKSIFGSWKKAQEEASALLGTKVKIPFYTSLNPSRPARQGRRTRKLTLDDIQRA